ncbi:MAG: site-2 protease family protein [Terracidiphilus sp.]
MSRRGLPIGRIFGISIDLDYSWFLIVGLLAWMLAVTYFPSRFPDWSPSEYWGVGLAAAVLLFASVLLHELGHSVVAQRFGIPVPRITLFLFGGVAQIATDAPTPGQEFWISAAGPFTSLMLAALFWGIEPLVTPVQPLLALARYLALINVALAIFNLVPGYPLDGGRIFRAFLWKVTESRSHATVIAGLTGRFFGFVLIFWGIWQVLTGRPVNGIWIALIGWFVDRAAASQIREEGARNLLRGHVVSEAMGKQFIEVPGDVTVQELASQTVQMPRLGPVIVTHDGVPEGMVTLGGVRATPAEAWPTTKVGQIMIPIQKLSTTRPDAVLWSALEEMGRAGATQLFVLDGDRVVGVLSRENILHYLAGLRAAAA